MGSWKITSSDGGVATIDDNGKAVFEPNTTYTEKHFTVTYTNGDVTCDTQVVQKPKSCSCNDLTLSPASVPAFEWDAHTKQASENVTMSYQSCITNIRQTSTPAHFNVSIQSDVITISPKEDNNGVAPYNDTLTLSYDALGVADGCTKNIQLTQNISSCDCPDLTVSPTSLTWDWNDTIPKPVTITADACVDTDSIKVTTSSNNFSATLISPTLINISPTSEATEERNEYVTVSYTAGSNPCSSRIAVHQYASECDCDDVPVYFPNTVVGLGKGKYQIGMVLGDQDCESGLTMYSSNSQVLGWEINDSNDVFVNLSSTTEPTIVRFGYKVDGKDCGERYIMRRICPCPIDNCWTEGVYEHPMHIDFAYKDYPGTTDRAASPHTGDSILIPVNRLVYNGTIIRGATIEYNPYPQITGGYEVHNTGLAVGDVIQNAGGNSWVTIIIRAHETGCITIDYYATENTSDEYRDADIYFDVDLNNGETKINEACLCEGKTGQEKQDCLDNLDWRNGLVPCESFKVILRQAPNGYKYRRTCIDQYTGNSKYVLYKWDVHVDDCSTAEGSTNPCGKDCSNNGE